MRGKVSLLMLRELTGKVRDLGGKTHLGDFSKCNSVWVV